ncbi:unnamed protein product [Cyprideis torosa]|uniref:Uncharacterized protein n=1 Tax=Cyprideis torosa TaxID=163714 RepID=A0A7R8W984_9CRUS|nr:unnamed protein product [Cyprideis torosa]CAG0889459.1 unnamed protein product [Cyprideis torosa]
MIILPKEHGPTGRVRFFQADTTLKARDLQGLQIMKHPARRVKGFVPVAEFIPGLDLKGFKMLPTLSDLEAMTRSNFFRPSAFQSSSQEQRMGVMLNGQHARGIVKGRDMSGLSCQWQRQSSGAAADVQNGESSQVGHAGEYSGGIGGVEIAQSSSYEHQGRSSNSQCPPGEGTQKTVGLIFLKRYILPKTCLLRKKREFDKVYRQGRRLHGAGFSLIFCENGLEHSRLGISIHRRLKGAVRRNRIKRIIRESFRLNREKYPLLSDIVFAVRVDFAARSPEKHKLSPMQLPRRLAVGCILLYRYCVSPVLPPSCRFTPTCSRYAIEAIEKYGLAKGCYFSLKRIFRCHPFCRGGYDPLP